MNSKLALYTNPTPQIKSYYDIIDMAAEYNIGNIETINGFELREPNLDAARKLREYGDSKNVHFSCCSIGINLVGDNNQNAIEKVKKYADVAEILGAPYIHHTIALEFTNPNIIIENYDTYFKRGIDAVREIYDYAKERGVRAIYEDQGYLFNGINGFKNFLNVVDRDVGVVADFGNIMFVDETIEKFIYEFSDRIVNVHIKDYKRTLKTERNKMPNEFSTFNRNYLADSLLGEGSVDFGAAFAALEKINYNGSYSLESPPITAEPLKDFIHNVGYIKQFIK